MAAPTPTEFTIGEIADIFSLENGEHVQKAIKRAVISNRAEWARKRGPFTALWR